MKLRFTILSLVFLVNSNVFSQEIKLTEQDLIEFKERAGIMIDDFQDYLGIIASKRPDSVKNYYIEQTLELFVNRGERVTMQTSSTRTSIIKDWKLNEYLQRLSNPKYYAKVEISQAETFYISNFYEVGENKYEAAVTIFQKFCGYVKQEGKLVKQYCDVTKKTVKVHVELVEDLYGKRWVVKLGDVSVAETTE